MSDQSRRKLLKKIAAGGGAIVAGQSLPDKWARPVVDSVMLPVHAQTSPPTTPPPTTPPPTVNCVEYITLPNSTYIDFGTGNYLPAGTTDYSDSACTIIKGVSSLNTVLAASNPEAVALCVANGSSGVLLHMDNNVWACNP